MTHDDITFASDFESLCFSAVAFARLTTDTTTDKQKLEAAHTSYYATLQRCMESAQVVFPDKPRAYLYDALKHVLKEAQAFTKEKEEPFVFQEDMVAFIGHSMQCVKQEIAKPHYMPAERTR